MVAGAKVNVMAKISVALIVALLVGWFGHAFFFPPRETYDFDKAVEICHQAQRDKWRETAVLQLTDEWKTDSRATNDPGWFIMGGAFAVGEDGATTHFAYSCIFNLRDLTSDDLWKVDPPEDRD